MNNNDKKLYDDEYMNWMMLNPDLYGSNRHRRTGNYGSYGGADEILIFLIYIIIAPFIFIKKIVCNEPFDSGDLALALAGLFIIIIIIGIIHNYKSNNETFINKGNYRSDDIKMSSEENNHHNRATKEKYVAKNNNSFVE